jgi:hypothetical protein
MMFSAYAQGGRERFHFMGGKVGGDWGGTELTRELPAVHNTGVLRQDDFDSHFPPEGWLVCAVGHASDLI